MDIKEVLKKLPAVWGEVKTDDFIKLIDLELRFDDYDEFVGFDNILKIASVYTNIPYEELEELKVIEVSMIASKLKFMNETIPYVKNDKFQWKELEEITMDDYLIYLSFQDEKFKNLEKFITIFNKNGLTKEQILELPIGEVLYGFFLFRSQLDKLAKNLIKLEHRKLNLMKIKMKAVILMRNLGLMKTVKP